MALPLPRSFHHSGWTIRYAILSTPSTSTSTSTTLPSPTKTLIFVHGTPWSSTVFLPLVQALNKTYNHRILLYDLPGYGCSQTLDSSAVKTISKAGFAGDTSVAMQGEVLAALLRYLELEGGGDGGWASPAVIAHDIGGAIALRAHLVHGVEFERLMMWDTNAVLPWGDGLYRLCRENPQVFVKLPLPIFEAVVRAVTRSACVKPMPEDVEEAIVGPWLQGEEGRERFVRQIAQAEDGDVREMLDGGMYERVRCGVRILWGERDGWIPKEKMEEFAGLLGERLDGFVVVPGAGHLLMVDQPENIMGEVIRWLSEGV